VTPAGARSPGRWTGPGDQRIEILQCSEFTAKGAMARDDHNAFPFQRTIATRRQDLRFFRGVMVVLAVATVLAAGALLPWHARLGLSGDEARRIATLFLLAGMADTLVLYFWDRLFGADA
jgi:hypothetical protein